MRKVRKAITNKGVFLSTHEKLENVFGPIPQSKFVEQPFDKIQTPVDWPDWLNEIPPLPVIKCPGCNGDECPCFKEL